LIGQWKKNDYLAFVLAGVADADRDPLLSALAALPTRMFNGHLVGGNPTDPKNLWPEPRKPEWNAKNKDQMEFALYKAVCRHDISLDEARQAFATDWIKAYNQYGSLLNRYIEGWYNTTRMHSSLGYKSPTQFERDCVVNSKAANDEQLIQNSHATQLI
jgi:hypothetical protein